MADTIMTNAENEVSLIGCMQDVPDPRAPYNQKHKFLDIIIIAVTAVLSGTGAGEYGKSRRAHWGIENSLHWVLDIGFREDESRIRSGNAAENVNVLRHIGTNLLKQEKSCRMGIAGKRKKCGYDMDYLYKVLGGLSTGIEQS